MRSRSVVGHSRFNRMNPAITKALQAPITAKYCQRAFKCHSQKICTEFDHFWLRLGDLWRSVVTPAGPGGEAGADDQRDRLKCDRPRLPAGPQAVPELHRRGSPKQTLATPPTQQAQSFNFRIILWIWV